MARFLATCLFLLAAGCAATSDDSPSMAHAPAMRAGPLVVMEPGLGDDASSWRDLKGKLSARIDVYAHTRPGFLVDDPLDTNGDGKRSAMEAATALHADLEQAGRRPPYLLVGHSIGGQYVLAFARTYPLEVSGVVLVDARPPGFPAACRAEGLKTCAVPRVLKAVMPPEQRAEVDGEDLSIAELSDLSALANIPVTVITSTRSPAFTGDRFQSVWMQQQKALAAKFPVGRYVEARGASHYIHQQKPALVAGEILALADPAAP